MNRPPPAVTRLAVFDLDGTITRHDSMLPFVFGYLLRHPWRLPRLLGVLPAVAGYCLGAVGRGGLKGALLRWAMGGLPRAEVDAWAGEYIARLLARGLFPEARAAINQHRADGDYLVLMSASVDCYVPRIGAALGFDETICSSVLWRRDGTLDGRLAGSNIRGQRKVEQFQALTARLQPAETVAYGNSRADLPHLSLATRAFYVNGKLAKLPGPERRISVVDWR